MNLGFIGTGTISAAIVRGLGDGFGERSTIHLSPRSKAVATALAAEFAHVHVAASNQAVLDASNVVMLAVRPQVAREVIPPLRFRPDHHVISLIATLSLEALGDLVTPARTIAKAVPLPAVALGRGATAIYPPDPVAAGLFDRTGTAIQVDDPMKFDALTAATATMASYFAFADAIASWLAAERNHLIRESSLCRGAPRWPRRKDHGGIRRELRRPRCRPCDPGRSQRTAGPTFVGARIVRRYQPRA